MGRTYQLASCPVEMIDPDPGEWHPCGADLSTEVYVHSDGAEYGVWTSGETCASGHASRDIARAEQRSLLGIS